MCTRNQGGCRISSYLRYEDKKEAEVVLGLLLIRRYALREYQSKSAKATATIISPTATAAFTRRGPAMREACSGKTCPRLDRAER